jgi:hypothetical protein
MDSQTNLADTHRYIRLQRRASGFATPAKCLVRTLLHRDMHLEMSQARPVGNAFARSSVIIDAVSTPLDV